MVTTDQPVIVRESDSGTVAAIVVLVLLALAIIFGFWWSQRVSNGSYTTPTQQYNQSTSPTNTTDTTNTTPGTSGTSGASGNANVNGSVQTYP